MRSSAGFPAGPGAEPAKNTHDCLAILRDITNLQSKAILFEWSALPSVPDIELSCMRNDQFYRSEFVNSSGKYPVTE
jgi:hypothetical protein